jgi:NAD(P)-dependent dehydrogenase (short-subunit alcohol dehydrogenase family)
MACNLLEGRAIGMAADLSDQAQADDQVARLDATGGVDILVNNNSFKNFFRVVIVFTSSVRSIILN